jgi:hypothetical protein
VGVFVYYGYHIGVYVDGDVGGGGAGELGVGFDPLGGGYCGGLVFGEVVTYGDVVFAVGDLVVRDDGTIYGFDGVEGAVRGVFACGDFDGGGGGFGGAEWNCSGAVVVAGVFGYGYFGVGDAVGGESVAVIVGGGGFGGENKRDRLRVGFGELEVGDFAVVDAEGDGGGGVGEVIGEEVYSGE